MKLKTIWTMPAMSLRERFGRTYDLVLIKLAHHLPASLKYRVFLDVGAANIRPDETVPSVYYFDILQRMEVGRRGE
jgi:hypothetical protein